jgi:4-hydroxy-2-oxoglutarate aldolase
MTISLRGVFGPLTTPFAADGELDRAAYEANISAHLSAGMSGIVASGSTGEAALLDEREREKLVEWARLSVPSDRLLIAGVGAESTRSTLTYAANAARRGADAVLVVAPHYFASAMTETELRAHYRRIADESRVPVILYNIPKYMHFRLSNALVRELATHENVIGIKDSSGDRESFDGYLSAQSDSFNVLTGNGQFWKTALQMGARGGILAVGLFLPELTLAVQAAVRKGEIAHAEELQERLSAPAKVIVGELGVAGVKAAMDLVGLRGGAPRSPLLPLGSEDVDRVRQLLRGAEQTVAA